jgi:hypothetical protein
MLHEAQNAFRRGRSTDQHIYTLSQVLRGRLRQGKATCAFFLDLKKAYDTVWRDGLLYKLWNRGIRGKAWQYIRSTYATTSRAVRCGQHTSEWFGIDLGTAQGDLRRACSLTSTLTICCARWTRPARACRCP